MRHTFIFSDLHLAPAASGPGVWMRFRQRRYFADEGFAALVERLLSQLGDAALEVVFNGDTFELDGAAGWAGAPDERPENVGRASAEAHALDRVLRDHHVFVAALRRLAKRAERVVFVSGNHDQGLCWPEVQGVLEQHVAEEAPEAAARLVFRRWFHRTEDGIYVEHGHQYDPDSAVPDPLLPERRDGQGLWLSLGSAGLRHILGGIGTMNPHVPDSFRLGGPVAYLRHWTRHYLGRSRSLMRTWVMGAIRAAFHVLGQTQDSEPGAADKLDALSRQARESRLGAGAVRRLRALQVRPVSDRPYAVWRQLWLDRLVLVASTVVAALLAGLLGGWVMALVVIALFATGTAVYEHLAPGVGGEADEGRLPWVANRVCELTGDRLVVLGHTHHPGSTSLTGGGRLLNTGAWAPAFRDAECTQRVDSDRTFAWVRTDGGAIRDLRLLAWQDRELVSYDDIPAPVLPAPADLAAEVGTGAVAASAA